MEHTVFVPDVSSRDWASLIALAIVSLLVIGIGAALLRRARRRVAVFIALLIVSPTLLGLGALIRARAPQFTEIAFSSREMVVSTLGKETRLVLRPENAVLMADDGVMFVSGKQTVKLPFQANWQLDGLVVDARYLANEFAGRSR